MKPVTPLQRRIHKYKNDPAFLLEGLLWDINEAIVQAMGKQDVSRAELANRLGTSKAYITKILRGEGNLTLRTLIRITHALDLQLELNLHKRHAQRRRMVVLGSPLSQETKIERKRRERFQ